MLIGIREATHSDIEKTFEWVNNTQIRAFSYNKKPVLKDDHVKWFESKLASNKCRYYILEEENEVVGSIRFDIEDNGMARISYLIDPNFSGRGFGTLILREGIKKLIEDEPSLVGVYGHVMKSNKASIRIFQKLDFELIQDTKTELLYKKAIK